LASVAFQPREEQAFLAAPHPIATHRTFEKKARAFARSD
jgi:hypothetical protein